MGVRRRQLGADEEIVVEVRRGRGRLLGPLLLALVAGGLGVAALVGAGPSSGGSSLLRIAAMVAAASGLLALGWLLLRYLAWRAESVTVTTERLILTTGVLRRRADQVLLSRVVDVHVEQRLRQRLIRRGDLLLELSTGETVVVEGLGQPEAFQRVLLRQADAGLLHRPPPATATPGPDPTPLRRPLVVSELDPTPPHGTPSVSTTSSTAALIRLDEIDRLEAEGSLDPTEATRRRAEIRGMQR